MEVSQVLQGAKIVISGGSSDAARASMTLLKAGGALANAKLISIFERAQRDIIKELARLTNSDLVTFHVEAALARVTQILQRMKSDAAGLADDFVGVNMVTGRLGARIRTGSSGELSTALDLARGDEARVQRIVNQFLGNIDHAASCAEQAVRNQVNTACVRAQTPKFYGEESVVSASVPSITQGADSVTKAPKNHDINLTSSMEKLFKENPEKAAKNLTSDVYKHVSFMRNQYVIGRRETDLLRRRTLESMAVNEARGTGLVNAEKELISSLADDGVVAFVDRGGHKWNLSNYCTMTLRTTTRTSENVGVLYEDPEHDLYRIVPDGTHCPICSKYEGRVYSRSGKDPNYPSLAEAFGSIDREGEKTIENSYLSIHPNCRHVLAKWIERSKTPLEIEAARRKSNPATNPFDIDPRSERSIKEYKEREKTISNHEKITRIHRAYLLYLPSSVVGNLITFEKHYEAKDDKYKKIKAAYQMARKGEKGSNNKDQNT